MIIFVKNTVTFRKKIHNKDHGFALVMFFRNIFTLWIFCDIILSYFMGCSMKDDIFIRYLQFHYENNGTINDIGSKDVVDFEGQEIKIGLFLASMKMQHRYYLKGINHKGSMSEASLNRYSQLDSMNFAWNGLRKDINLQQDIYIRYLNKHYAEFGTINNIKSNEVVDFEGEKLNIGRFLKEMRCGHSYFVQGENNGRGSMSLLSIARYQALEDLGFRWHGRNDDLEQDIYIRYLCKHYDEHGTINNIKSDAVVDFEGQEIKIGLFLQNLRAIHKKYLSNPSANISQINKERFALLDSFDYHWVTKRCRKEETDLYIQFLKDYYQEHGTINNIGENLVVVRQGRKLDITQFLNTMRKYYTKMENNEELSLLNYSRIRVLTEMGFYFQKPIDDVYINFLREYYLEYGTVNDIEFDKIVIYRGESLRIGEFLKNICVSHKRYLENSRDNQYNSQLMLYRYQQLEQMGIDWSIQNKVGIKGRVDDDIFIRYLNYYYDTYGTINNIDSLTVVNFEDREVKIGAFLTSVRRRHRLFLAGSERENCNSLLFVLRYKALDEMDFLWEPTIATSDEKNASDPFVEYLKLYYEKNLTINDIKRSQIANFKGKKLQIGVFLSTIRQEYNKYLSDPSKCATPLLLKRYEELKKMRFDFSLRTGNRRKTIRDERISGPTKLCDEFLDRFEDSKKAQKFVDLVKLEEKEKVDCNSKYTLAYTSSVFGLDADQFADLLNKNFHMVDSNIPHEDIAEIFSLKEFAKKFGYSYKALLYAVKLRENNLSDEDISSLVIRGLVESTPGFKWKVPNWIYSKYGNRALLNSFLESVGLEPRYVYENMRKEVIPIDQAIVNEAFRVNTQENGYSYLKGLYSKVVSYYDKINCSDNAPSLVYDAINIYLDEMQSSYFLTDDETGIIERSFQQYVDAIRQFQLYDVAFEKDEAIRLSKQEAYHFDEEMDEEAFFMPLQFPESAMMGRNLELFQRRSLVKTLKDEWSDLSEFKKISSIVQYELTHKELGYIEQDNQQKAYIKNNS